MAKQSITIQIDGVKDRIDPKDVARALAAISETLQSVDANLWELHKPRYKWFVTQASKASPLQMKLEAELPRHLKDSQSEVDVVSPFLEGMRALSGGRAPDHMPRGWGREDVKRVQSLSSVVDRSRSITISNGTVESRITLSSRLEQNADALLRIPVDNPACEYGEVVGRLRQVTVDPRDGKHQSKFQIIERDTDQIIACNFDPSRSGELHPPARIVAFGMITYRHGMPHRLDVDDFDIIPDNLPTLSDLRGLRINITDGEDSADFVDELRGEGG